MMVSKTISSTEAQNNFGRVLDDVTQNHTRYVIHRRGVPQVLVISFDDFAGMLDDAAERRQIRMVIRELRPDYELGQVIDSTKQVEE